MLGNIIQIIVGEIPDQTDVSTFSFFCTHLTWTHASFSITFNRQTSPFLYCKLNGYLGNHSSLKTEGGISQPIMHTAILPQTNQHSNSPWVELTVRTECASEDLLMVKPNKCLWYGHLSAQMSPTEMSLNREKDVCTDNAWCQCQQ